MFDWTTLLDAVLGGDGEALLVGTDGDPAGDGEEEDEPGGELVPSDYAESRQAHRRIRGVAG